MFGVAPNEYFMDGTKKCGICYEMVGPSGTVRLRVDNMCPVEGNEAMCSGDMIHFDISNNAMPYVNEYATVPNVTIRMVACDYEGPLKVKSMNWVNEWGYEIVVLEHTLGVKAVEMKDSAMDEFVSLNRSHYNTWRFVPEGREIAFPLTARVHLISDDKVDITGITLQKEKVFEADRNFIVPENKWYDIEPLDEFDKPLETEECCSLYDEDFTEIYKDKILGVYNLWGKADVKLNDATDPFEGKYCVKMNAKEWEVLQLGRSFPVRADQYTHLHFAVKGEIVCEKCLLLRRPKIEIEGIKLDVEEENVWKEHTIALKDLNITTEFWGFWMQNLVDEGRTYFVDDIYLLKNQTAPDTSQCWEGVSGAYSSLSLSLLLVLVFLFIF